MKKACLKGFTMIEMIITMVIVGILGVVLVEAYMTVSRVALRVEQQKNISEESLTLTQIFQSISDEATIDYERYNGSLDDSNGFVDILYLTGGNRSGTSIYTTGDCLDLDGNFSDNLNGDISDILRSKSACSLILQQNDSETNLNTQGKVVISKIKFRVIPYNDDDSYFSRNENFVSGNENVVRRNENVMRRNGNVINDIHQPAFWVFLHLYAPLYQTVGANKIDLPLQLFFNLNV